MEKLGWCFSCGAKHIPLSENDGVCPHCNFALHEEMTTRVLNEDDKLIKSAFEKINSSSLKTTGCKLSNAECRAIANSCVISNAVSDEIGQF